MTNLTPSVPPPGPHRFTGRREWGINPDPDKRCVICAVTKREHPTPDTDGGDREQLVAVICESDPGTDMWDARRLAVDIVAAGFTRNPQTERYLPYHLNELAAEIVGLRDALWMATQALGISDNRAPEPVPNPERGPLSNRVIGFTAILKELHETAHRIRGRLP